MRFIVDDHTPSVHADAWIAPGAVLAGAVRIESGASVWFGSVLRADGDTISVGEGSNLQDGVIVHADPSLPVTVGRDVSVGHGAVLHGCSIGEGTIIGMRATVLNGAKIGPMSLVAAGAVVLQGAEFEPRSLIAGIPAKRLRELTDEECAGLVENAVDYQRLRERYRGVQPR